MVRLVVNELEQKSNQAKRKFWMLRNPFHFIIRISGFRDIDGQRAKASFTSTRLAKPFRQLERTCTGLSSPDYTVYDLDAPGHRHFFQSIWLPPDPSCQVSFG